MPNTRTRGIPVIESDPELERILRRMNQNLGIQGDEVDPLMPPFVDAHDRVLPDIVGMVKYGENFLLHTIKSTTGPMKILQTQMDHSSFPLYHMTTLL